REAGGVRVERQDGAALGRGDGRAPQHARGPLRLGQRGGLLARRETYPNKSRRHYSIVSYHDIAIAIALTATVVSHLCTRPVDLFLDRTNVLTGECITWASASLCQDPTKWQPTAVNSSPQ
ncbi:vegetative incompatibility protein het-e-1, partial [Paraphaeosphaeria sporulosa]